jgi:hypothetical protein
MIMGLPLEIVKKSQQVLFGIKSAGYFFFLSRYFTVFPDKIRGLQNNISEILELPVCFVQRA